MQSEEAHGQATMERISTVLSARFRFDFWGKAESDGGHFSTGNMLSSEEASVDRPGARADHGQSAAQHGEKDRDRGIAGSCQGDPYFDHRNQCARNRSPEASQQKESQNSRRHFRDHQASRRIFQSSYPVAEQSDRRDESLKEEAEARPAIRKCREKTLQGALKTQGTALATTREALKAGTEIILSDESELDDPTPEPDGHSMSPIAGAQLRENVGDAALDRRLRNGKNVGDLLVGIPGGD